MQQRKSVVGRPSGTDGSDFSYRMVVDQRYKKVAEGKSRLRKLLLAQAIIQVLGVVWMFLSKSQEMGSSNITMFSIAFGFISLIIGELGRQRSLVALLRLYSTASSMAVALSVACLIRNDFFFQVIRDWNPSTVQGYELVEMGRVAFGVLLQIVVIITTISLMQNMSPKRASQR
uniref:Protein jagunal 1 n=1 Tax=Anthurium amnicola TaxID=1678845 RepID=A0A1D1YXM8_9ARAE